MYRLILTGEQLFIPGILVIQVPLDACKSISCLYGENVMTADFSGERPPLNRFYEICGMVEIVLDPTISVNSLSPIVDRFAALLSISEAIKSYLHIDISDWWKNSSTFKSIYWNFTTLNFYVSFTIIQSHQNVRLTF